MMLILFASILSIFGISHNKSQKDDSKSLCDEYPLMNCIEFSGVKGDYADSTYVTLHRINNTRFKYKATSENSEYPLKNAFDESDSKSYWAASTPNSDSFHNSITVEFNETVTIEAVLYYASFFTRSGKRIFNGSPTKLKIYSSIKEQMFQLEAIFVGELQKDWGQFQYVFSSPVRCDKIKLEFIEVTADTHTSGGKFTPVTGGITFVQQYGEKESAYSNKNGKFKDNDYFNAHKISSGSYKYDSTPSKKDHPIEYAFDTDNKKSYWVSLLPNNDTFRNSITVTFEDIYSIECFVYYPAYNTRNGIRVFQGAPTRLNVYTSIGDKEMELTQVFFGNPQNTWEEFQFMFPKPVRCTKIMLEFAKVTPDYYDSNGEPHPVVGGLSFIADAPKYKYKSGTENKADWISLNDFTYEASESHPNYPIKNAFDNNLVKEYWVGNIPNSETFNNYITVTFKENKAIKGFQFYPAFNTRENNRREFQGMPLKLYVLSALENEKLELRAIFESAPENDWKLVDFPFDNPIVCRKIKLQFVDVTPDNGMINDGKKHPSTGGIAFLKTSIPSPTEKPPATPVPPDPTPARTPFPPAYSCGETNNRCDIPNENNLPTHVSVSLTNFTGLSSESDGGAIHLVNSALECENVNFDNCHSNDGGGGGVFVNNNVETSSEIKLDSLNFTNCKAKYGGAVYIYSSSSTMTASVLNCKFVKNEATASKNEKLNGGSALFLNVRNGVANNNVFIGNVGNVIKVVNNFDNGYALALEKLNPSVLVSKCLMNNGVDDSSSLLFYVAGENGVKFEIVDCVFSGKLNENAHFIDGVSVSKDANRLLVKNCRFSYDSKRSLNLDSNNDYISIDLKNQVFNFKGSLDKKNREKKFSLLNYSSMVLVGLGLVVLAVLAILLKNKRQTQSENEESTDNDDNLIIQSLI